MNAPTTVVERTEFELAERPTTGQSLQTVEAPSDAKVFFQVLTTAAANPKVDIEKMERLWAMHERLAARDSEQVFNMAMMAAQADMGRISADATNSQTRSKYATYGQIDRHVRPIYTKHGFSLSFDTADGAPEGCVRVVAYVTNAGHCRTYRADIPADGKGARGNDVMTKTHANGSAMSYGMRYLVKMIFNVAIGEDDDDGNGASVKGEVVAEVIAQDMLSKLLEDLQATTTDAQAAQHWATGSKAIAATKSTAAYQQFKAAVVKHRNKLKDAAK
jgi:hypothetical protein